MKSGSLSPQMTIHEVAVSEVSCFRHEFVTGFKAVDAAGVEPAARGDLCRARDVSVQQDVFSLYRGIGDRYIRQQRLGVGMGRVFVDLVGGCELHDPAEIHDGHTVREVVHQVQVVGNEQERKPHLGAKVVEQVDDLCLHRDIKRRDRFVSHDEGGVAGERPRDADALALAAGEFMGVAAEGICRKPHLQEQGRGTVCQLVFCGKAMDHKRFDNDLLNAHPRVEGGKGVLEDDLHLFAERPELVLVQGA